MCLIFETIFLNNFPFVCFSQQVFQQGVLLESGASRLLHVFLYLMIKKLQSFFFFYPVLVSNSAKEPGHEGLRAPGFWSLALIKKMLKSRIQLSN